MSTTLPPRPVEHAALHRLACQCGARCPDCGGRGGRLRAEPAGEADADFAVRLLARGRRAVRAARGAPQQAPARRPAAPLAPGPRRALSQPPRTAPRAPIETNHPRNPRLPGPVRAGLDASLRGMGWSGWQRPASGRAVTVQDIVDFQRAGGVREVSAGGRRRKALSARGREMLRDLRYAHLRPLFQPRTGGAAQNIYEVALRGRLETPLYVGKSSPRHPPGLRLLEHLDWDRKPVGTGLRGLARQGRLHEFEIGSGRFSVPDLGRRSHLGEVMLQELHNPRWNSPHSHGFEG